MSKNSGTDWGVQDDQQMDDVDDNEINDGRGLEVANPSDFFHRRDSDDELQPVLQQIPGREQAMRVVPPTTGDYQKFHLGDEERLYADDELFAEFVNAFFVDLEDEVTEQDVRENLIAFGAEPLVDMVKRAGGMDMKDALDQRQIEQMMELMGGEDLDFQQLIKLADERDEDEET